MLQPFVKCFWTLLRTYTSDDPIERVTPDGWVELIFNFGDPYVLQVENGLQTVMPSVLLVGLHRKPLEFRCNGTVNILAARLFAWTVPPLLSIPAHTPTTPVMQPGGNWEALARSVESRVRTGDYEVAITMFQDYLKCLLSHGTGDVEQIQDCIRALHAAKGHYNISALADRCNLSQRQLQRQFQEAVGMPPKALSRSIRFESVRMRLMLDPTENLTDLAYEFGYADQAHFIHDFKNLAGVTPGEFAATMQDLSVALSDNVVFLQSTTRDRE